MAILNIDFKNNEIKVEPCFSDHLYTRDTCRIS